MLRTMIIAGLAGISLLGWADFRGWGAFDATGQSAHARGSGGTYGSSGRLYHK